MTVAFVDFRSHHPAHLAPPRRLAPILRMVVETASLFDKPACLTFHPADAQGSAKPSLMCRQKQNSEYWSIPAPASGGLVHKVCTQVAQGHGSGGLATRRPGHELVGKSAEPQHLTTRAYRGTK